MDKYETCSHTGRSGALFTGLAFIVIGVLFLLNNFGLQFGFMTYRNWWALFILIGAVGPLVHAVQRYQRQGRFDGRVLHSLVSAAAIITIAAIFLLDLAWDRWWPVFIIFGGLWTVSRGWQYSSPRD